ncbi:NAD(P)/FAD-dependent oxidoreductase [Candidatus Bathyarchaeota archaeon]|nr:MAG: NAD(P)/FAD-dependent oxidoreductase [Candidatus Bathyarchaeota archaeon]
MSTTEKYDVAVIGAGVSGLLSALALGKEGKKVLVVERENYIGGTCRTYEHQGYKIDTGPHIITRLDTGPLRVLMDKYFDVIPYFVPFGKYFLRINRQVKQFPWSVKDWMMFELLPVEDRSMLVKIIFDVAYMASTGVDMSRVSISDITPRSLSHTSHAFIDYLSYFMLGTGPANAPVSRFLDRKSYKVEKPKEDNGLTIPYVGKAYNMLVGGRPTDQFYPRGGVQTIVDALSYSLPEKVKINLGDELVKVDIAPNGLAQMPKVTSTTTYKGIYETDTVIYSGYATDLPRLIDSPLPSYYVDNLKKIEKVNSLSVWLGLDEPIFKDEGSEMWVSTSPDTFHTWMIPTSNYDPTLAPKGKHLVGFAFIVPPDMPYDKAEEKARHTIFSNIPALESHMNMIHYQHLVPEKATWSIHAGFGDIKTPVKNLYCVGSDSFKRSMGLTRASYSVHKMLDTLGLEGNLNLL